MILVTGATGIVGSQIVRYLVDQNEQVRAIKRESSDVSWLEDIDNQIDWIEADIMDLVSLENAFEGVTHVVHCAAIVSFDNSNDKLMHKVNVEGTKNVLELCEKFNIQKLIFISSVAALGRNQQDQVITEDAKWVQSPLNTEYAISKYKAELEVWRAQEEGLSTAILNPSIVIGPGNWSNSSLNLFKMVKNGTPIYPTGSVNCVDVRDIAEATHTLLKNKIEGERFILNASMISYKTFFDLVAKAMNKKPPRIKVTPGLATFAASLLRIVRFFTGMKTNITRESVMLSQLNIMFSSEKAERMLGMKFRPVEESVQWTYEQIVAKTSQH